MVLFAGKCQHGLVGPTCIECYRLALADAQVDCAELAALRDKLLLQVEALQKQLRTAQEVINKHATDGIEGLHCVDCVALADEMCDCPMLVPFWGAMKGYTEKRDVPIPNCAACHVAGLASLHDRASWGPVPVAPDPVQGAVVFGQEAFWRKFMSKKKAIVSFVAGGLFAVSIALCTGYDWRTWQFWVVLLAGTSLQFLSLMK